MTYNVFGVTLNPTLLARPIRFVVGLALNIYYYDNDYRSIMLQVGVWYKPKKFLLAPLAALFCTPLTNRLRRPWFWLLAEYEYQ